MVGSLYNYLKTDWNKPTLIGTQRIKNDTAEHIDTHMLADEIVNNLIQMRISSSMIPIPKRPFRKWRKG
jgi:hypothetical protein